MRHEPMPAEALEQLKIYYPEEVKVLEETIKSLDAIMQCGVGQKRPLDGPLKSK